jgi:hypothetical protein
MGSDADFGVEFLREFLQCFSVGSVHEGPGAILNGNGGIVA